MAHRSQLSALGLALFVAGSVVAGAADSEPVRTRLGVSPMLVDAAAEVWKIIAAPDNPVWPGWNARDTPLLLYLPNDQELLIGHPRPPAGFRPYAGPLEFPGASIWVRNDTTLVTSDGQNTSMDVEGVRTLVVADPLSNLRLNIASLLEDPRPGTEKARKLEASTLAPDPYAQLGLIVHEAFHVFQDRAHPERGGNEGLLAIYPVLSVDNNVGFGLEALALDEVLRAKTTADARRAALRWLAAREERRRSLDTRAIQYEDGTEFAEGLAKYTEYQLWESLEGREPSAGLARAQGFAGYHDLSRRRAALAADMRAHLRGEVNVNNAPFGTAPARMRLYYSGMGIAVLLDRLAPGWKQRFWESDSTLTGMARTAIAPSEFELRNALAELRADTAFASLRIAKERLARDGARDAVNRLAAFGRGPGVRLIVDYGALDSRRVRLAFTPFGITRVDTARVIFDQVPVSARFDDGSELRESHALPLLRDTLRHELHVRLEKPVGRSELRRLAGGRPAGGKPAPLKLALPGLDLDLERGTWEWSPGVIRVRLWPAPGPEAPSSEHS